MNGDGVRVTAFAWVKRRDGEYTAEQVDADRVNFDAPVCQQTVYMPLTHTRLVVTVYALKADKEQS